MNNKIINILRKIEESSIIENIKTNLIYSDDSISFDLQSKLVKTKQKLADKINSNFQIFSKFDN